MEPSARHLSESERTKLQTAFHTHGNSAAFWDVYQTLLREVAARAGDQASAANELAQLAVQMGATDDALLV